MSVSASSLRPLVRRVHLLSRTLPESTPFRRPFRPRPSAQHWSLTYARSRRLSDMDVDEETRARRLSEKQAAKEAGLVKRKVGLHLGYVGTDYSGNLFRTSVQDHLRSERCAGLQFSSLEHVKTIESVLLAALRASGCVTESNAVSLSKINWSRSSRTDKGVHSLATVTSFIPDVSSIVVTDGTGGGYEMFSG